MKLSDTRLLILSSASRRIDHAAVLPANLKGSAAKKVVDKLLNEKLLQELRAKDDTPVWRRGDDNRPYSLRISMMKMPLGHMSKCLLESFEMIGGRGTPAGCSGFIMPLHLVLSSWSRVDQKRPATFSTT